MMTPVTAEAATVTTPLPFLSKGSMVLTRTAVASFLPPNSGRSFISD
jgi:hypothetical protein